MASSPAGPLADWGEALGLGGGPVGGLGPANRTSCLLICPEPL